jgi:streptogramin lyase
MRHHLSRSFAFLLLALAIGCAPEDDAPLVTGARTGQGGDTTVEGRAGNGGAGDAQDQPRATPTPTPGATPTPSPTPTTSVSVGTDPGMPTSSVDTLPTPYLPPVPTPTPLGHLGSGVSALGARDLAVGPQESVPWLLTAAVLTRATSQGADQPLAVTLPANPHFVRTGGDGAVWVAGDSELARFSPGMFDDWTRQGVALAAPPSDMADGGDSIWLCSQAGGTVTRVQKATFAVTSYAVPGATAIALDPTAAWVVTTGDQLLRLDRTDGTPLRAPVSLGAGARSVTVGDDGAIWVASRTVRTLSWLLNAGASPVTIPLNATPLCLQPAGSRMWVGCDDGRAYLYDGTALTGTFALPVIPRSAARDGLGRVWFLDTVSGQAVSVWGR